MVQSNEISIEQMNEAIARFMGLKPRLVQPPDPALHCIEVWHNNESQSMQYHTSWDWLMPVVEKIEKDCNAEVEISHCCCYIGVYPEGFDKSKYIVSITYPEAKTKIEATQKAAYQFIQWLNQQKQNNG